jgi:predicted porin
MNNMKKSAIAVAVAAVLAAPVALADVSISGQLQTQVVSYGGDAGGQNGNGLYVTDGGMFDTGANGGNWGAINVVASEDLGDGMKALAKYAFNVNTGSTIGTREAYVGLAGGFGAVLGGRLNHPYKTSTIGWDPFVATFMQARGNGGMAAGLYGAEMDNALAYAGSFGAAKVVAAIVVDEANDPTATNDTYGNHAMAFSVNAPVGPVELALAYVDMSEMAGGAKDASAMKVGVKWTSGDFTVAGQMESLDKGLGDDDVMFVTGSYKMGSNTVSASFGSTGKKIYGTTDDVTYIALGVDHAMSKNTSAFVGFRSSDAGTNADETAIGGGLRVKF